jgi:chromosome segregation ATPase
LAADDLDEEVADAAEDEEVWNPDDHLEEAPNPQSGNDEAVAHIRFGEQLVDFLPPPNEDAEEDTNRDVMSEMAVGGAPSLLPDAIEDDFGPVVDQIPVSSCLHSHESTSTQVTASECRSLDNDDKINGRQDDPSSEQARNEIVVDQLPLSRGRTRQDSAATVTRSQISEDEEDASKFGPVVDQLPTSRASFAPSRGGSTVDALGTVSEVNSDDDGEGWDDDADFDTSTAEVSDARISALSVNPSLSASASHDRNTSVRFDTSAGDMLSVDKNSVQQSSVDHQQGPEKVETQSLASNSNRDYTDENLLLSTAARSFAEAETPPSTPYRRAAVDHAEKTDETSEISVPHLGSTHLSYSRCESCCNAIGVDCPCVRRLIDLNRKTGSMVCDMKDFDGTVIKVDFSQLLQDEITRRRLLEEEIVALKSLLDSDSSKLKLSSSREQELEAEIRDLRSSQDSLSLEILKSENETASLHEKNESLQKELRACRCALAEITEERDALALEGTAIVTELQTLKNSLPELMLDSTLDKNQTEMTAALLKDLATKKGECEELKATVDLLELHRDEKVLQTEEMLVLKNAVDDLKYQLVQSELVREKTETARNDLETKLQSIECEMASLRSPSGPLVKQLADLQIQHEKELQQNYKLLDKKTEDIRNLEKTVALLQVEKNGLVADLAQQRSLAEQSESLANELIDLLEDSLKENQEALLALQRHIEDRGSVHQQLHYKKDQELVTLQERCNELTNTLLSKDEELRHMENQVDSLTKERDDLSKRITEKERMLLDLQNTVDAAQRNAEIDKKKIIEFNEWISSLEEKMEYLKAENERLQVEAKESATQATELKDKLQSIEETSQLLAEKSRELEESFENANRLKDSLSKELDDVKSENKNLLVKCAEMENQYSKSLIDFEAKAQQLSLEYEEDLAKLRETSDQLKEEVVRLLEAETHHALALEEVEKSAEEEMNQHQEITQKLNTECSQLREELSSYKENIETLSQAVRDLELEKAQLLKQRSEGNTKLSAECKRLQQEVSSYQALSEETMESLQVLQKKFDEKSQEYESMSTRLVAECESLKDELRRAKEEESNMKQNFEIVQEVIFGQKSALDGSLEFVKGKCDDLRKQVEHHRAVSEELVAHRNRLGEVERECVIVREENEELLIQLALLKQQKDESEQMAEKWKSDFQILKQKHMETDPEFERLRNEQIDQQRHIDELMIKNNELEKTIQSLCEKDSAFQQKIEQLMEDCSKQEKVLQFKDIEIETVRVENRKISDEAEKKSIELKRQLALTQEKLLATEASLDSKTHIIELVKELELQGKELESQLEEKDRCIVKLSLKLSDLDKQILSAASSKVELEELQKQTVSLSEALQLTRNRLAMKEEDVDRLSTELRNIKSQRSEGATNVAGDDILHHSIEAKRGSELTKNVIEKASTLKRTESMRAQAIQQLKRERELNAENFRRLRDVVEKFYS